MRTLCLAALLMTYPIFAQEPSKVPPLGPGAFTSLQALEQQKKLATEQYNQAQQQEAAVIQEWQTAHPGWKIDPKTFVISAEEKPKEKK